MASATKYVTRAEFDEMSRELEKLNIRFEVLTADSHRLDNRVGDLFEAVEELSERMDARFDKMDARLDKMDARLDRMDERFNEMTESFLKLTRLVQDSTTALHSAILSLAR